MDDATTNDTPSDLWISLEDAVEATGVSRRNLQQWVRSGQIKREKRKGKVFLWVSDLAELTPITRVDTETLSPPEPEMLPTVMGPSVPSTSMKAFGDRLKESVGLQKQILERLDEVQSLALQNVQREPAETKPVLDDRTVKELSLLGNVFRSIHQQNEKVNEALIKQDELLKSIQDNSAKEKEWSDRWVGSERKIGKWKVMSISAATLLIAASGFGAFAYLQQRELTQVQIQTSEAEKQALADKILLEQQQRKELLDQKKEHLAQTQERHEKEVLSLKQEHESSINTLQTSLQQQLTTIKTLSQEELTQRQELWKQEHERLKQRLSELEDQYKAQLQNLQAKHNQETSRIRSQHSEEATRRQSQHTAEAKRLRQLQQELLQGLSDKIDTISATRSSNTK